MHKKRGRSGSFLLGSIYIKGLQMRKYPLHLLLIILLSGCATRVDMRAAFQDIEELKARLNSTEKNISTVKSESREISEKSSREALKNLETLRKGTADMQANLDGMRLDVQVMAGKVDDLGLAAKKPFDDITLLKEDTSKAVSAMDERIKKLESDLAAINEKLSSITKALEVPPTADNLYKEALDALKTGDTGKARDILNKFNETYPGHKLSPNVRYWIGETWYIEKNYEQAVLEFQRVIKEFPGKEKVSAAMLKQAMAFKELGDSKSAKFVLKELIEKFPQAEEIPAAKELLGKTK
jgi:tol-pal system protein YbgF